MYDVVTEQVLTDMKKYCVEPLILSPTRWKKYFSHQNLTWEIVKFEKSQKVQVPDNKSGVYSFIVKPTVADHPATAYLLYVGKAEDQSLRKRFLQYFTEMKGKKGRPKIQKMLKLWTDYLWFCFATVDEVNKIHDIENQLISAYVPPCNDQFPADIRSAMKAW